MFAPACQSDGSIALLLVSGWFTPKLCVILGIVLSLPICLFVNASFGVRYSIESVCCVCGGGLLSEVWMLLWLKSLTCRNEC